MTALQAKYAMVEFKDPEDALKALKLTGLKLEGKKLVIKPRRVEQPQPKRERKALDLHQDAGLALIKKNLSQCGVNISEERMKEMPQVSVIRQSYKHTPPIENSTGVNEFKECV